MRSTCGRSNWLLGKDGELVGFSLGADATTEHEMGSRGIAGAFGYDYGAAAGVMARKVTQLPDSFGVEEVEHNGERCLLMSSSLKRARGYLTRELRFMLSIDAEVQNSAAAWDESNFAIVARGTDIPRLQELADAFQNFDVMAGGLLRASYPREVGGLAYAIASRVPEKLLAETQAELDETVQREGMLQSSGVLDRLKAAGRKWFSLSTTRWADDAKTGIVVWLNPYDQHRYIHGWYTLQELEQWVTDEGPIAEILKK